MKTGHTFLGLCFMIMMFASCGTTNKIIEPSAKSRAVDRMVAAKEVVFKAEWARPMATQAISNIMVSGLMPPGSTAAQVNIIGSGYFFKMEGDSVSANLPYFGERQMGGGYGSDSGIEFKGVPRDLKIEKDETKLRHAIKFNISKQTETYRCRLDLLPNKKATLLINSSQRFTIRYEGQIAPPEADNQVGR